MPSAHLVRSSLVALLVALPMLVAAPGAGAQDLSVLAPQHTQLISQEVSGDAAYEHIRFMTQFHRPGGGADGLWKVAEYLAEQARAIGLSDVQVIKQTAGGRPWNARFADLWIVEPEPVRLASTLWTPLHLFDNSRSTDVTAELVDVGEGREADFEGTDVRGKIVLTYGSSTVVVREAVGARGALGVVWFPNPFRPWTGTNPAMLRSGQVRWASLPSESRDGMEPTFAFSLSMEQGVALRARLAQATAPVRVHAVVDAAFTSEQGSEPWDVMVEAFIRGTEPGIGQDIVLTGHMQEEKFSANDDASGCASTLEVARALQRLISDGKLPRPRRNLRFWWTTEISSERQYFADHPDASKSIWVNVNQDMVGADQSQDPMRKQNITRLPATRFHFFNDVVESVVEYMVVTNTYELAQAQAGHPLYPKAHVASLGSRDRYNAATVFFHTSTDHMTFLEAPIGIPGVTFTNMPDFYIHSSDDDLWNIDRTQLGRSAAAVALMAYAMANAGEQNVPALAAATVGRGAERLAANLRLGLTWIAGAADKTVAYFDATDQVRYAAARERLAVRSLGEIARSGAAYAEPFLAEVDRREAQALREVDLAYRQATGQRATPKRVLSEAERQLAELKPALEGGPAEFLRARGAASSVPDLHGLMAYEILNAVNGARTGLDIYRYIAAEAREAGAYYYGIVRGNAVLQYLTNLAEAKLIRLR